MFEPKIVPPKAEIKNPENKTEKLETEIEFGGTKTKKHLIEKIFENSIKPNITKDDLDETGKDFQTKNSIKNLFFFDKNYFFDENFDKNLFFLTKN